MTAARALARWADGFRATPDVPALLDGPTWACAAELLRAHFPYQSQEA